MMTQKREEQEPLGDDQHDNHIKIEAQWRLQPEDVRKLVKIVFRALVSGGLIGLLARLIFGGD